MTNTPSHDYAPNPSPAPAPLLSPASPRDFANIAEFINRDVNPQFAAVLTSEEAREIAETESEESIRRGAENGYAYWVSRDEGGRIAALANWRRKNETAAYLGGLYVRKGRQGGGIGTRLLREIEGAVKAQGYRYLLLETQKKFTWAVAFYRNNKYAELTNENLAASPFAQAYPRGLVESSVMFYKSV